MVESTVDNCHYESVTTKVQVQMPLYREIQGLYFYAWFVRVIMDSNEYTSVCLIFKYMYFL